MGDAKTPTGRFSWCTFGAAALGAHVLLLWSMPVAPVETAFTAATTVIEWESWQAPATSALLSNAASAAEPAAALAIDRSAMSPKAPQSHRRGAVPPQSAKTTRTHKEAARGRGAELQHGAAQARTNNSPEALRAQAAELQQQLDSAAATGAGASLAQASEPAPARSESADATTAPPSREPAEGAADTQLTAVGDRSAGSSHTLAGHGQASGALLRGPRLLAAHDPCAGFFPGMAEAKRGQVQLSVEVDAQGHPHPTQTLLELPRGQGFETAAKACATHLHFAPALDAKGRPVNASARIALRFERS